MYFLIDYFADHDAGVSSFLIAQPEFNSRRPRQRCLIRQTRPSSAMLQAATSRWSSVVVLAIVALHLGVWVSVANCAGAGGAGSASGGGGDTAAPSTKGGGVESKRSRDAQSPAPLNRRGSVDPCYDATGAAKRCIPEFVNAGKF